LTYVENRSASPDERPDTIFGVEEDDEYYTPRPEGLNEYASQPLSAQTVFSYCINKLGIPYSGIYLASQFSKDSFTVGNLVATIDGLLASETYCAYIDGSGVLRGMKYGFPGTGPAIDKDDIIKIEGINSGDLPGDGVFVRYTTKKVKPPEWPPPPEPPVPPEPEPKPEKDPEAPPPKDPAGPPKRKIKRIVQSSLYVSEGVDTYAVWETGDNGKPVKTTQTDLFTYQGYDYSEEIYDERGRLRERLQITNEPFGQTRSQTWIYYPADPPEDPYRDAWFEQYDPDKKLKRPWEEIDVMTPIREYTRVTGPGVDIARRCGYEGPARQSPVGRMTKEIREVFYHKDEDMTSITENLKIPYYQTPHGSVAIDREMQARQDSLANKVQHTVTGAGFSGVVDIASNEGVNWDIGFQQDVYEWASGLSIIGSRTRTTRQEYYREEVQIPDAQVPEPPAPNVEPVEDIKDKLNALPEEPGPEITSKSELAWAAGSQFSPTIIEFSLPYTPEDVIAGEGNNLYVIKSNAQSIALQFGRIQNKLLYGNRSGINLQLPYHLMPPAPLSLIYLTADNLTGTYLTNGTSYVFNGSGIIATTDALFWGAAA
jgi:hypothetical protein